tara:strand:+ start:270 stop:635 length:366 start_codon:yes stop_codon:yes gene_type:complete
VGKLLETRLPNAIGEVSPDVYNRLVRVLELNLGSFDPTATPQYTITTIFENKFNPGDVIWNISAKSLQVFDGEEWHNIYASPPNGVSAAGGVGDITVQTNGNVSIDIGAAATGWDTEQWYT